MHTLTLSPALCRGLPGNCPEIFGKPPYQEFYYPKYFAGDYFQRVPFNGYQHSWPSLFIGANQTESSMHVDSGGTNFWMYLLSGKKEWKFFDRSEMIYLYAERWVAGNLTKSRVRGDSEVDEGAFMYRDDCKFLIYQTIPDNFHVTQHTNMQMRM